jgi:hypothetical protein
MLNTISKTQSIELKRTLWPAKKGSQHKKIVAKAEAEESLPLDQVNPQESAIHPECVFFAIEVA